MIRNLKVRMFRFIGIFIAIFALASCNKGSGNCSSTNGNNSMSMYCHMSPHNVLHRLYTPPEVNEAPHLFYKDNGEKPVYSFENACGEGAFLLDQHTNELYFAIAYSDLSGSPVMMHFHLGNASVGGPVIQTIFGMPSGKVKGLGYSPSPPLSCTEAPSGRSGFVTGIYKLQGNAELNPPLTIEMEREAFLNGDIYINVHTYLNEKGEIRGQIFPCEP